MPIHQLPLETVFPNPDEADDEGLVAYGGDLSVDRLIAAYRSGIFPWYDEYSPDIMWWSPNPRMIMYPDKFKLSKSLRQKIRRDVFELRFDTDFKGVMGACAQVPREEQDGTWITDEMQEAYLALHQIGLAHSVECWLDGELVGGLYGVSLGNAFFGESMFHYVSDASKVAYYYLCQMSKKLGIEFIDCQMHTDHLESLGAVEIPRSAFLALVQTNNKNETNSSKWESGL